MSKESPPIEVACAVIERDGQILAAQRGTKMTLATKWEFPGGKLEPNEEAKAALVREITEELACQIEVLEPMTPVEHRYPEFFIRLMPFRCRLVAGEPRALEHLAVRWCSAVELDELDWAEADVPILRELLSQGF